MPIRRVLSPGDVIAVPLSDGPYWALGKVLYVSGYFKDVMLLGFFRTRFDDPSLTGMAGPEPEYCCLLYTAASGWERAGWRWAGSLPLLSSDAERSLRVVAQDLWLGDCRLGTATETQRRELPRMGVLGFAGVVKRLEREL